MPLQAFPDGTLLEGTTNHFDMAIVGPGSIPDSDSLVRCLRKVDSSVCLPIALVGDLPVGAGTTYALGVGADDYVTWPSNHELLQARMEALLAARVRNEFALVQANDRARNLELALQTNRSIGTALGILMATQKVTSEEAFLCLKNVSQRTNRKLRDIAEEVIYTGALDESL